jgi:hypothetical protein
MALRCRERAPSTTSKPAPLPGARMSPFAGSGHGPREEPVGQASPFCLDRLPTGQKSAQPRHAPVCGSIGLFMHALWTIWESVHHVRASSKPISNLLRLHETPLTHRLLLACIGQTKTTAAGDIFIAYVDHCAPSPTIGTFKPWSATPEMTRSPANRYPLDHRNTL